jgi:hypothetical protein
MAYYIYDIKMLTFSHVSSMLQTLDAMVSVTTMQNIFPVLIAPIGAKLSIAMQYNNIYKPLRGGLLFVAILFPGFPACVPKALRQAGLPACRKHFRLHLQFRRTSRQAGLPAD